MASSASASGLEDADDIIADLEQALRSRKRAMIRFSHVTKEYPRTGVALQ